MDEQDELLPGAGGRMHQNFATPVADVEFPGLEVLGELGRGAQTVVYRARRGRHEYAVKLQREALGEQDERAPLMFRREAAILACLRHPGLAEIYEVGEVAGRPYLVMELLEGCTLAVVIEEGRLDVARLVAVGMEVAGALGAAHRQGLVHRDVKPQNVYVGTDGHAKLIDFGLAVHAGGEQDDDAVAGTVRYSPPEQTGMLKRPVDHRSDLYALGAVLFECAAGTPPFASSDVGELIRQHAVAPPPDIARVRPDLPLALAGIITKLLAKDPDDRYQSGESLVRDLAAVAAHLRGEGDLTGFRPGLQDAAAAGAGDLPLLGREQELRALTEAWSQARAGHGSAAVITGPPGSGKTRLLGEVAAAGRASGTVLRGRCSPGGPVPLSALREAVQDYLFEVGAMAQNDQDAALERVRSVAERDAVLLKPFAPGLAELLGDVPDLPLDAELQEQVVLAVAGFFLGLSRACGGLVLVLDDVHWLDNTSRRVLQQIALELASAPLLLVGSARHEDANAEMLERFRADVAPALRTRLDLGPLDDEAVTQLVAAQLGGTAVEDDFARQLAVRAAGNPFAVLEYLRLTLNAGLLRPVWGRIVVDPGALDSLRMPTDVAQAVLQRIDQLGPDTRTILTAAAAVDSAFRSGLLTAVCGVAAARVDNALADALRERLIEPRGGGHAFVHERLREALLSDLGVAELRALHQRVAEALEGAQGETAEHVYAVARHYALGEVDRTPERVVQAGYAAGLTALADHAPEAALEFMERAAQVAQRAGIALEGGFEEALGAAYLRGGRLSEAQEHLERALTLQEEPLRRAQIFALIARVHYSRFDHRASIATVTEALRELDHPLPRSPLLLAISTLGLFLVGVLCSWTGWGFGTVTGAKREHYRMRSALQDVAAQACYMDLNMPMLMVFALRSVYIAHRVGPSPQWVKVHAGLGTLASVLKRRRLSASIFQRTVAVARGLQDPQLVAYTLLREGFAKDFIGDNVAAAAAVRRVLREHGRWLDFADYLTGIVFLCWGLNLRGYTREMAHWNERAAERAQHLTDVQAQGSPHVNLGIVLPAMLGQPALGLEQLRAVERTLEAAPEGALRLAEFSTAAVQFSLEQDELGEPFEAAIAAFGRLGLKPGTAPLHQSAFWVHQAYGRLAQYQAAGEADRPSRLEAAEVALAELRKASSTPLLRAHHLVAGARLLHLRGSDGKALDQLARAERLANDVDAPWVSFEVAKVRAQVLQALGKRAAAAHEARSALWLANEHGWVARQRVLRTQFHIDESPTAATLGVPAGMTAGSGAGVRHRRHLDALLQVGVAASKVLDPRELARVALDEIVGILGAERALLFLTSSTGETVELQVGRDADGNDLDLEESSGYGSTLVEQVRATRKAVVVTGTDQGAALGSESAVQHGLRSILVAPLQLEGRLLGVVYLDSRLAKGVFSKDDVDILVAIANHVAVSLETARTAQLEVDVQAERRQRGLAETLRDSMITVSSTLDPAEVIARLLESIARVAPYDDACVLVHEDQAWSVVGAAGAVDRERAMGTLVVPEDVPGLAEFLTARAPVLVADCGDRNPLPGLFALPRSLIGVPLVARGELVGLLLIACERPSAFSEAQAGIAAAFAGQGFIAYENARLFTEVRRLAVTDELTGVANRRHFFDLGSRTFDAAQRHRRPLAAVMVDIDHFKRINDTHGHAAGDDVIRAVAQRAGAALRAVDILGRYGGEEFALILPETAQGALDVAERVRQEVGATPVATRAGPVAVTISAGVAVLRPEHGDLGDLLNGADAALYEAKRAGRNQVGSAR